MNKTSDTATAMTVAPATISNHVADMENSNLHLSCLLESLRTVCYRLDGKSKVTEGSAGSNQPPREIGLLERQQDALCYQQSLLCDIERELDILKELV